MKRWFSITLVFALVLSPCGAGAAAAGSPTAMSDITVTPQRIARAVAALDSITRSIQRKTGSHA